MRVCSKQPQLLLCSCFQTSLPVDGHPRRRDRCNLEGGKVKHYVTLSSFVVDRCGLDVSVLCPPALCVQVQAGMFSAPARAGMRTYSLLCLCEDTIRLSTTSVRCRGARTTHGRFTPRRLRDYVALSPIWCCLFCEPPVRASTPTWPQTLLPPPGAAG